MILNLPVAGEQPNSKLVLMLKKQNINLFPNHKLKKIYKIINTVLYLFSAPFN
jgi:hypothetical protein